MGPVLGYIYTGDSTRVTGRRRRGVDETEMGREHLYGLEEDPVVEGLVAAGREACVDGHIADS